MDYKKLNHILDTVESVLLHVGGEFQLAKTHIERWRWDEPHVTLNWSAKDEYDINRNVHVSIDENVLKVVVEVNGWTDKERDDGLTRIRFWKREVVATMDALEVPAKIPGALAHAFKVVVGWKPDALTEKKVITAGSR